MRGWLIVGVAFFAACGSTLAERVSVLPRGSVSYGNAFSSDDSAVVVFNKCANAGRAFGWIAAE